MDTATAASIFAVLGHEGRLSVLRLLARRAPEGVRPGDMAAALDLKPNTLSVYLSALERAGLVTSERHGKAIHYRVEMPRLGALVDFLVADCCHGRPALCAPRAAGAFLAEGPMPDKTYNVLFICTGNSARSVFAEALLRDLGQGRFNAFSAGTRPSQQLNAFAVEVLDRNGHDTEVLWSKGIETYQRTDAPQMDFVFTVCDAAANEECPPWFGQPLTAHWGLPDPVKATGSDAEKALAFAQTYGAMRRRIEAFVNLPMAQLDRLSLQDRLDDIADLTEGK